MSEFLSSGRRDGRKAYEIRGFRCELGYLERADGSCRLEQGRTQVVAAVYGPLEARGRNELPDRTFVDVSIRPFQGYTTDYLRLRERELKEIFDATIATEIQPRSCVTIVIQIIENDGSLMAAVINACMLSLLSAGIPCHWLAASCTVSYRGKDGVLLDPTLVEELEGYATSVISYGYEGPQSVLSQNLIGLHCNGFVSSQDIYFSSLSFSQEACRKV
ncbi:exosome complex component RRP46 [Galdieria sulphuraria]|uniref:Exosome complex component RRP46 n=1 Tax=Galdieria sulphuraria TaxID=130081 RepID=M2Y7U5_GALSU|nr:exosome complex component RRP46 [Galdieria sulphuraria]EME32153.1 exosome complex component RRP46 [Galdieria sulphuraria]|eukprot:XP_005708673.1 exosome complex component RRP46 [Galdieria sulphuraria]